jgi:hypothetical protein
MFLGIQQKEKEDVDDLKKWQKVKTHFGANGP